MPILYDILEFNHQFVNNQDYKDYITDKHPNKKAVILSCMDTRLTELLPQAMHLKNGDAKIVKNAGATIMHPFGSIMRSIILAVYEFNTDDVIVVGHYGCGMCHLSAEALYPKMIERGITQETLNTLRHAGIDVDHWLNGFDSEIEAVKESVRLIKEHPLMPKTVHVHGLIMDPTTGKLEVIIDGYQ